MRRIPIVVGLVFAALSVMPLSLDAQKSVSYRQVVEQASTTTLVSSSVNPSAKQFDGRFRSSCDRSASRYANRHRSIQRRPGVRPGRLGHASVGRIR